MMHDREASDLFSHTVRVLEWANLLEALTSHARSSLGAARCRALELTTQLEEARRWQQETSEMAQLQESADAVPALSFPDIREPLSRASKGAVLEGHELRDHASVLILCDEVHAYLRRHFRETPALAAFMEPLQPVAALREIRSALETAIHADGSVKESATPELHRLMHHASGLKQHIRLRIDHLLQSRRYEDVLQEHYFDQREGRYVLPVKAEMQGRVPGIVHDVSSSGATVFIEPRELVDLNNAIKVADREVDREVTRILRELSGLVGSCPEFISARLDALARLDVVAARASFGRLLRAKPVALNAEGVIRLKEARHPLLAMAKEHVVANDVVLDESIRVLIISGPNTGGKTVTLKMVGLFALMVRAGLPLPCAPGSEMALFANVYADIGDSQDLARDLSSFSAQMTLIVALLREAHETDLHEPVTHAGQALILMDEPVTSTDPTEGAALAEVLLCRLARLGMKVIATTHYRSLKVLAQTTSGFANASVEFDVTTLSPTYRLLSGMPGGSSAIEIARRLGMDDSLLEEARQKLEKDDRVLDEMLENLQTQQRRLSDELSHAVRARSEAEEAARSAKEQLARLEATEREERRGIKKKFQEQFSRAKAEVQATVEAVKREQKLFKAREAKEHLIELEARTRAMLEPKGGLVPVEGLQAGDQVEIGALGMVGILLESPQGKKRVRVKVGEGEVSATVANLVGLTSRAGSSALAPSETRRGKTVSGSTPYRSEDQSVVDVRGKAADDAIEDVIAALDRAALNGVPALRVIHGHGTGRLKSALRDYFRDSAYVVDFRPGHHSEGGDGVTVVTLK
ncbi:MAG TPA: endonuclease MutS2 [Nitrospira sp.]|nr:endonuclease MutS2 [Nitrospira sp.]